MVVVNLYLKTNKTTNLYVIYEGIKRTPFFNFINEEIEWALIKFLILFLIIHILHELI